MITKKHLISTTIVLIFILSLLSFTPHVSANRSVVSRRQRMEYRFIDELSHNIDRDQGDVWEGLDDMFGEGDKPKKKKKKYRWEGRTTERRRTGALSLNTLKMSTMSLSSISLGMMGLSHGRKLMSFNDPTNNNNNVNNNDNNPHVNIGVSGVGSGCCRRGLSAVDRGDCNCNQANTPHTPPSTTNIPNNNRDNTHSSPALRARLPESPCLRFPPNQTVNRTVKPLSNTDKNNSIGLLSDKDKDNNGKDNIDSLKRMQMIHERLKPALGRNIYADIIPPRSSNEVSKEALLRLSQRMNIDQRQPIPRLKDKEKKSMTRILNEVRERERERDRRMKRIIRGRGDDDNDISTTSPAFDAMFQPIHNPHTHSTLSTPPPPLNTHSNTHPANASAYPRLYANARTHRFTSMQLTPTSLGITNDGLQSDPVFGAGSGTLFRLKRNRARADAVHLYDNYHKEAFNRFGPSISTDDAADVSDMSRRRRHYRPSYYGDDDYEENEANDREWYGKFSDCINHRNCNYNHYNRYNRYNNNDNHYNRYDDKYNNYDKDDQRQDDTYDRYDTFVRNPVNRRSQREGGYDRAYIDNTTPGALLKRVRAASPMNNNNNDNINDNNKKNNVDNNTNALRQNLQPRNHYFSSNHNNNNNNNNNPSRRNRDGETHRRPHSDLGVRIRRAHGRNSLPDVNSDVWGRPGDLGRTSEMMRGGLSRGMDKERERVRLNSYPIVTDVTGLRRYSIEELKDKHRYSEDAKYSEDTKYSEFLNPPLRRFTSTQFGDSSFSTGGIGSLSGSGAMGTAAGSYSNLGLGSRSLGLDPIFGMGSGEGFRSRRLRINDGYSEIGGAGTGRWKIGRRIPRGHNRLDDDDDEEGDEGRRGRRVRGKEDRPIVRDKGYLPDDMSIEERRMLNKKRGGGDGESNGGGGGGGKPRRLKRLRYSLFRD